MQSGINKKGHRGAGITSDDICSPRTTCRLHYPTHDKPGFPVTSVAAGETEEATNHRSRSILTAAPESIPGEVGTIQDAAFAFAIFLQSLQHEFGLCSAKQQKCQGNTFENRRLDLFR